MSASASFTFMVPDANHDPVEDHFEVKQTMGAGTFSIVRSCVSKENGQSYALKIIDKSSVGEQTKMLKREVDILSGVEHPNVVRLFEIYESSAKLFLVMELVTGGELFDRIVERGSFSELDAAEVMRQLLDAIKYLHDRDIVHRDLKPENILMATNDPHSDIKLADFGLSSIVGESMTLQTACGTPSYVAPEVLMGTGYGKPVDLWSAGVICYILLCGYPPFWSGDGGRSELFEAIMNGDFTFDEEYWSEISEVAKDLIERLIVVEVDTRLTADGALEHPWVSGDDTSDEAIEGVLEEMKKFNAKRKFKMAILQTVVVNRFKSVRTKLRRGR